MSMAREVQERYGFSRRVLTVTSSDTLVERQASLPGLLIIAEEEIVRKIVSPILKPDTPDVSGRTV